MTGAEALDRAMPGLADFWDETTNDDGTITATLNTRRLLEATLAALTPAERTALAVELLDPDVLAGALRVAGFDPPDNVCKACGHHGGDHDLGNWCLICPRPDLDPAVKWPMDARLKAGWCYFGSMNAEERWTYGKDALLAALRATTEEADR